MQGESEKDMKASDLIKELQERIEIYGDLEAEEQASALEQTIYINCGEDIVDVAYV